MRFLLKLFLGCFYLNAFGQSTETRNLTVRIIGGLEPLPGATLYLKGSNPPRGAVTDVDGIAVLDISEEDELITISPFNPPLKLENFQNADSIIINLSKSKVFFFRETKRIRKENLRN